LYVWKTVQLLQVISKKGTRRVMWQLFTINLIIIAMDIGLLAIEYKNLHVMEQTFKSFIYSVKLKLEFAILGKLVELVQSSKRSLSNAFLDADTYIDATKTTSSVTKVGTNVKRSDLGPQWMADLEKSNAEHIEHTENRDVSGESGESEVPADSDVDEIKMVGRSAAPLSPASPTESRRRTRTDSDLMYAEAMRSISLS
jgi:hypothetical protein